MYSESYFNEKQREFIDLFLTGLLKDKINKIEINVKEESLHITYAGKTMTTRSVIIPNIMDSKDLDYINEQIDKIKEIVAEEHIIENLADISLLDKGTIIYLPNGKKLKVVGRLESNLTVAVTPYYICNSQTYHGTYYIPFELVIGSKVKIFD